MLLLSRYHVNLLLTILSKVLHRQLVRVIDLYLLDEVWSLSGFGGSGMCIEFIGFGSQLAGFTCDHDDGKLPVCQMSFKL
jgi:hypothetical protein